MKQRNSMVNFAQQIQLLKSKCLVERKKFVFSLGRRLSKLGCLYARTLTARPVENFEELKKCFGLVYGAYLERDYCSEHPSQMHFHAHALLPEATTFVLKRKNKLVGTISLVLDSPHGLPIDSLYPQETQSIRQENRVFAEVTLLSLNLDVHNKKKFNLTKLDTRYMAFRLFKIMYEFAHFKGVTDLLITVNPRHRNMYKYLNFKSIGPVKFYPGLSNAPAIPLWLDLVQLEKNAVEEIRELFCTNPTPPQLLEKRFDYSKEMIDELLAQPQSQIYNFTPHEKNFLAKYFPQLQPTLKRI